MTNGNDSPKADGTSRVKKKNGEIPHVGLDPDQFYPLATACILAGIGVKHMEEIKRKYRGNGVHQWGHDVGCFGRVLIEIFITESEQSDE